MYKVGDIVIFTFLGGRMRGEIIEKVDKVRWKVKANDGTIYPFIFGKEPIKEKGKTLEKPLGVIIKKVG